MTEANLDYIGSITIDRQLMDAAGIIAGERVYIVDNNNGERFDTYVIEGEPGSGTICLNGAAARKVHRGDIVIIMSYAAMTPEEARTWKPKVVFPDTDTNRLWCPSTLRWHYHLKGYQPGLTILGTDRRLHPCCT